jgi:hypothetical protein
MDISKTLSENPGDIITFEDGPTVLATVKKLREEKRLLEESAAKTVGFSQGPTHWILAVVLAPPGKGKLLKRIICFPKGKYNEGDVLKHVDDYTREVLPFDGE